MKGVVRVHEIQRQGEAQEFTHTLAGPGLKFSHSFIRLKDTLYKDIRPFILSSKLHRKLPIILLAVLSELLVMYISFHNIPM